MSKNYEIERACLEMEQEVERMKTEREAMQATPAEAQPPTEEKKPKGEDESTSSSASSSSEDEEER